MILPTQAANAQAVAYSGGQKSTAQSGFGSALTAMLAQMQATAPSPSLVPSGLSAHHAHRHGHGAEAGHAAAAIAPPKLG